MSIAKIVEEEWLVCFTEMANGEFVRLLNDGGFTVDHYKGFLRETFHNASLNPRLGSLFHAHLGSEHPALEARFLKHNAHEIGHNNLALADLGVLGDDTFAIRKSRPLPATEAMAGFIAFQIQHRNPLAYLGYLYHLEAIAVGLGAGSMSSLSALGIPDKAFSFLREHAEADTVHMQFNRDYLNGFVKDDAGLAAVLYGLRGTCALHALMFQGIVDEVRRGSRDWQASATKAITLTIEEKA